MKYFILLYYLTQIQLYRTFYVPGVAPQEYQIGDVVSITAVTVYSTKTQLPYDYTHLGLCDPVGGKVQYKSENLGEILSGNRIVDTPYKVQMNVEADCAKLCGDNEKPRILNKDQSIFIKEMIKDSYFVDLRADGLPCATKFLKLDTEEVMYEKGYKLGYVNGQDVYLYNHLKFTFKYHSDDLLTYRVVGCDVEPMSLNLGDIKIKNDDTCRLPTDQSSGQSINPNGETKLAMTYSVKWEKSNIRWASRWDPYLTMKDAKIHWFSIINSLVIIFLLSGILAMIIIRTLRKDIARYNREEDLEDTLEESGWKLVHGDVFRPPRYPVVFCALIGSGIQIFSMSLITLVFAMLGMLSPASRGALMTAAIFLYVFMGMFAGYYSSRLYKTVKGALWKKTALYTATLYPGVIFGICFFLNFFIWGKHSSGAVPFTTMLAILCLWFGISLPLVYVGSYFGFRKQPYAQPVRTNQIPRQIPEQPWYTNSFVSSLAAGVLPFGGTFIELFFIFTAIWENQFYYLFGFLFIVFVILVISCAQISIVMVYFQLCNEDYRWWWKSFSVFGGGSALYVLGYSIFYFFTKLDITGFTPTLLYAGYTAIMVLTFWLLTGVVGFYASYFFIRSIYSAVKID